MSSGDLSVSLRSRWLAVIGSFPTPLSCQTEKLLILMGSADKPFDNRLPFGLSFY